MVTRTADHGGEGDRREPQPGRCGCRWGPRSTSPIKPEGSVAGFRRAEAPAAASWACSAWRSRTWIQIITECPRGPAACPETSSSPGPRKNTTPGSPGGRTSGRRLGQYFGVEAARGRKFASIPYSLAPSRHFLALQAYICRTVQLRGRWLQPTDQAAVSVHRHHRCPRRSSPAHPPRRWR